MITELARFVDEIPQEYHTEGLKPSSGLHILISLGNDGQLKRGGYRSFIVNKKGECFDLDDDDDGLISAELPADIVLREYFSRVIDSNKAVDTTKKIYSSVPYAIWMKPEKFADVTASLELFFKNARAYVGEGSSAIVNAIQEFCLKHLIDCIKRDRKLRKIKATDWVRVYFDVPIDLQRQAFENYLEQRLFVKDDYNVEKDGETYGLHGFLAGDNAKKQFMRHVTTPFLVGSRVPKQLTLKLYKFERLLANRKLPNPMPIFIDRDELNQEVVKLYSYEGVLRFRDIISVLFERGHHDLSNYYLLNWAKIKERIDIRDFDFVPLFRYELEGFRISNLLAIPACHDEAINDIFSFESEIVRKIFDNGLVVRSKSNELTLKYFDEIDPQYVKSQAVYTNILKYRRCFYDFIYKSRTESIQGHVFYDIVMTSILEEIRLNEDFNKTFSIKEKLNILFSLNQHFDKSNNNFGGIDMASLIPQFTEMMRNLMREDGDYHLSTDQEFAYAAGQLIYYILYQSQASNKSHSLLEPYISKSDPVMFKTMIARGIDQYKHALNFGHRRFNKLAGEVLGYDCSASIKDLLPVILAGYFSNSMIFEKRTN